MKNKKHYSTFLDELNFIIIFHVTSLNFNRFDQDMPSDQNKSKLKLKVYIIGYYCEHLLLQVFLLGKHSELLSSHVNRRIDGVNYYYYYFDTIDGIYYGIEEDSVPKQEKIYIYFLISHHINVDFPIYYMEKYLLTTNERSNLMNVVVLILTLTFMTFCILFKFSYAY